MTNPQNTQFYGTIDNPYPLEINSIHKFLIPDEDNNIPDGELELWCGGKKIKAVFGVTDNKLYSVTFIYNKPLQGRLEIRRNGVTLFYSNCVRFMNSTDDKGRKYIRVATRHNYNRHLFNFDRSTYEWVVTNLPAYCIGQFSVEAEISNARIGGNNTLKTRETYLDEAVQYHFIANGDANILAFIQVHTTNTEFYIDGTRRTVLDKIEADEFNAGGKLKFVNQKDGRGLNIILDEKKVFPQEDLDKLFLLQVSDTEYYFAYNHTPKNTKEAGQYFLVNRLFNNYYNNEEILMDCDLKAIVREVPTRGQLVYLSTMQRIDVGDVISYCDKDDVVYMPNGADNEMGVSGSFTEYLKYNIIDQWGNESAKINVATLHLEDEAEVPCVAPTLVSVSFRNNRDIMFTWDINGFADYSDVELEYSTDNGINYQSLGIYHIKDISYDEGFIVSDKVENLINEPMIYFRLKVIGGKCGGIVSNVIEKERIIPPETNIQISWYDEERDLLTQDIADRSGLNTEVTVGASEYLSFEYKNYYMGDWAPLFTRQSASDEFLVVAPLEQLGITEIRGYKMVDGKRVYSNTLKYNKTIDRNIKIYWVNGQQLRVGDVEDKTGTGSNIMVGSERPLYYEYKTPDSNEWVYIGGMRQNDSRDLRERAIIQAKIGLNEIRAYIFDENREKVYSNILRYIRTEDSTPITPPKNDNIQISWYDEDNDHLTGDTDEIIGTDNRVSVGSDLYLKWMYKKPNSNTWEEILGQPANVMSIPLEIGTTEIVGYKPTNLQQKELSNILRYTRIHNNTPPAECKEYIIRVRPRETVSFTYRDCQGVERQGNFTGDPDDRVEKEEIISALEGSIRGNVSYELYTP